MAKISKHAEQRLKERNGLGKKSYDRIVEKAYENGINHSQTKGNLHKWMSGLYQKYPRKGTEIKLYGDKAYIFVEQVLVTVLQIPNDIKKNMSVMIRKPKETKTGKDVAVNA